MAQSLFSSMIRLRWYLAGGVALGLLAAGLVVFVSRPVYRAEVTLLPADTQAAQGALAQIAGQFAGLAMMAGLGLGPDDTTREAVATLRSRDFSNRFLRDVGGLPILFDGKWDSQRKDWRKDRRRPTEWEAYRKFDRGVRRISENKATGLWTLSIDAHDPALAAKWANEIVSRVNAEMRGRAIHEADLSIRYLTEELGRTDVVELQQSIHRLIETQIKKRILARTQVDYAFKVIDPALPPDPRFPIWPRPFLLVLLALVVGATGGVAAGLWRLQGGGASPRSSDGEQYSA
ncbi:MAG TPA: hypothetical protein VFI92_13865 [Steroidobacteraceae bacterium]|nr:hypothetical protein [Steroidobacteraceae bacterium]